MKNKSKDRVYLNLTMLKALEDTDQKLVNKMLGQSNLDRKEISAAIEASRMGKYVSEKNGKTLQLNNETMMVGMSTLIALHERDMKLEY
jgi:hypothetical protein